jgi:UDP-N-acetylmuramoyl-tripeptide--D-alanyl-D-alanine ligase
MSAAPLWSSEAAAAATGGRTRGGWSATGVSIDSRTLVPGDLFVALRGPRLDGHRFVGSALAGGAAAVMVDQVPDGIADGAPLLTVANTQAGLERLGEAARSRTAARICAITGSVGKTGTKEALHAALSACGASHASHASFNNQWGVPLSLARMSASCDYGVFELGMNHAGELSALSRQVRPHVVVVTTVEATHLEHFPSEDAIADAKAEIFEGAVEGATAILNRDNRHFERLAVAAKGRGLRVVSFGEHDTADVRAVAVRTHSTCSCVIAVVGDERLTYKIAIPGRHWVRNSLAVLAAVRALGADITRAALALASLEPPPGRGRRHSVVGSFGAVTLIDDSYNASPASVRAALESLGNTDPEPGGRRIVVLGDMLELGPRSAELHAGLAADVLAAGVSCVHTAGRHMLALHEALPADLRGIHAATVEDLLERLRRAFRNGDVVLVKGSRASAMDRIVTALVSADTAPRVVNG